MTLFTNPVLTPPLRGLARIVLRLKGWRWEGERPDAKKYVATMAPHTSNWDFVYLLGAALVFRLSIRWLGKHSLFKGPFGPIMRWFGGVPVNRDETEGIIPDAVAFLTSNEEAALAIAPEGTRSKVKRWKTGFYRIAVAAEVPVLMTYLDYSTKTMGLAPLMQITGNMDEDIAKMQAFYSQYKGKNPADQLTLL